MDAPISIRRQRADRIRAEVPILQVLYDLGYQIDPGNFTEQQFSCDLHGTGADRKPSARAYPESNNWNCWGCGKARDAIETVKEKHQVSFIEACKEIERKYDLPEVDWGQDLSYEERPPEEDSFSLTPQVTFEGHRERCHKVLDLETKDKDLPLPVIAKLWVAYDRVVFSVGAKEIPSEKGIELLEKIKKKVGEQRAFYGGN